MFLIIFLLHKPGSSSWTDGQTFSFSVFSRKQNLWLQQLRLQTISLTPPGLNVSMKFFFHFYFVLDWTRCYLTHILQKVPLMSLQSKKYFPKSLDITEILCGKSEMGFYVLCFFGGFFVSMELRLLTLPWSRFSHVNHESLPAVLWILIWIILWPPGWTLGKKNVISQSLLDL